MLFSGGLDIGHVTRRQAVAFVESAVTDLPTHPPQDFSFAGCLNVMCNFVILLVSQLSRGMLCVHFYEFGTKVKLQWVAWHGYQNRIQRTFQQLNSWSYQLHVLGNLKS